MAAVLQMHTDGAWVRANEAESPAEKNQVRFIECLIDRLIDFQMNLGAGPLWTLCSFRQAGGDGDDPCCDTHGPSVVLAARRTCLEFPGIALAVLLGKQDSPLFFFLHEALQLQLCVGHVSITIQYGIILTHQSLIMSHLRHLSSHPLSFQPNHSCLILTRSKTFDDLSVHDARHI